MFDWYARAVEGIREGGNSQLACSRSAADADEAPAEKDGDRAEGMPNAWRTLLAQKVERISLRLAVYGAAGMSVMAATPARAFATSGSLDIRNVSSILDFLGNICIVVGVVLAGWNVVQAAQTAKETQGLQIDRSFWGIIGGVGMAIGGGAIKTAGSLWRYGSAS